MTHLFSGVAMEKGSMGAHYFFSGCRVAWRGCVCVLALFAVVSLARGETVPASTRGNDDVAAVKLALVDMEKVFRSGDVDKIQAVLSADTPEGARRRAEFIVKSREIERKLKDALERVNSESVAKFNKPLVPEFASEAKAPVQLPQPGIQVAGDRADITWRFPMGPTGQPEVSKKTLVRVNGVWKMPVVESAELEKAMVRERSLSTAMMEGVQCHCGRSACGQVCDFRTKPKRR